VCLDSLRRITGHAILCAAGPVMLLIAAGTGMERAFFVRSSLSTDGVVVGLRPVRPYRANKSWRALSVIPLLIFLRRWRSNA
jgi:hypothetical protein